MSHAFYLDVDRCVGCFACTVACMDQNDLEAGAEPTAWRQVFTLESGSGDDARLRYVSLACMHCEDAPCLMACPTGAIGKEVGTRVGAGRLDAVHRLPQLLHGLPVRSAPFWQRRHHAEVRPLQRPAGERHGPRVCAGLPNQGAAPGRSERPLAGEGKEGSGQVGLGIVGSRGLCRKSQVVHRAAGGAGSSHGGCRRVLPGLPSRRGGHQSPQVAPHDGGVVLHIEGCQFGAHSGR